MSRRDDVEPEWVGTGITKFSRQTIKLTGVWPGKRPTLPEVPRDRPWAWQIVWPHWAEDEIAASDAVLHVDGTVEAPDDSDAWKEAESVLWYAIEELRAAHRINSYLESGDVMRALGAAHRLGSLAKERYLKFRWDSYAMAGLKFEKGGRWTRHDRDRVLHVAKDFLTAGYPRRGLGSRLHERFPQIPLRTINGWLAKHMS